MLVYKYIGVCIYIYIYKCMYIYITFTTGSSLRY